ALQEVGPERQAVGGQGVADLQLPREELVDGVVQEVVTVEVLEPGGPRYRRHEDVVGGEEPGAIEPGCQESERQEEAPQDRPAPEPCPEATGQEPAQTLRDSQSDGQGEDEPPVHEHGRTLSRFSVPSPGYGKGGQRRSTLKCFLQRCHSVVWL